MKFFIQKILRKIGLSEKYVYNLPKKHLGGCQFFRFTKSISLTSQDYLICIELIRPLLRSRDFKFSTPGFYINYRRTNPANGEDIYLKDGGLRLTYYTVNAIETQKIIEKFTKENSGKLTLFDTGESHWPDITRHIETYNEGENETELKFRNTLNISAQIALDLLKNDVQRSFQKPITDAMISYIYEKIPPAITLEPIFIKHSNFFKKLKEFSFEQKYWENLIFFFPNGWPFHILANMLQVPEP